MKGKICFFLHPIASAFAKADLIDIRASTSVDAKSCLIEKTLHFTHFDKKNSHISECKIVHLCTSATVTVLICTITITFPFIILHFFLPPSPRFLIFNFSLSPFSLLSLVPQSNLTDMISPTLSTPISPASPINPTSLLPISLASLVRSHSPLILFNFLFDQFWIFYLINGF